MLRYIAPEYSALPCYYTLALSADGSTLYAANGASGVVTAVHLDVDVTNARIIKTVHFNAGNAGVASSEPAPAMHNGAALALDQKSLYVAGRHGIWQINTADLQVHRSYLTRKSFTGITPTPAGQTLYAVSPAPGIIAIGVNSGKFQADYTKFCPYALEHRMDRVVQQTHILIVDDEGRVTSALRRALAYEGYQVSTAANGESALALVRTRRPDLVILDLMLPGMDGLEVCRRLRAADESIAILMLTARDTVADRVRGLETGADDYLVKPFALEELLARVKALLRRHHPPEVSREVLSFADLELDTATRQARRGERVIELSTTEYELLALFLRNPRIVLTRGLLMDRIWGQDFEGGPNVLEVYIGHLRSKLEQCGERRLIQTVRGAGYVLRMAE